MKTIVNKHVRCDTQRESGRLVARTANKHLSLAPYPVGRVDLKQKIIVNGDDARAIADRFDAYILHANFKKRKKSKTQTQGT